MQLTLIRGLPGSGKSTLAKTMVEPKAAVHLEADMFFMSESGEYCYQQSKVKAAHAWCSLRRNITYFTVETWWSLILLYGAGKCVLMRNSPSFTVRS